MSVLFLFLALMSGTVFGLPDVAGSYGDLRKWIPLADSWATQRWLAASSVRNMRSIRRKLKRKYSAQSKCVNDVSEIAISIHILVSQRLLLVYVYWCLRDCYWHTCTGVSEIAIGIVCAGAEHDYFANCRRQNRVMSHSRLNKKTHYRNNTQIMVDWNAH